MAQVIPDPIPVEKKRPLFGSEIISEGHAYSLYDYDNLRGMWEGTEN